MRVSSLALYIVAAALMLASLWPAPVMAHASSVIAVVSWEPASGEVRVELHDAYGTLIPGAEVLAGAGAAGGPPPELARLSEASDGVHTGNIGSGGNGSLHIRATWPDDEWEAEVPLSGRSVLQDEFVSMNAVARRVMPWWTIPLGVAGVAMIIWDVILARRKRR